ncbi:MAG: exo-alpha-sialidase [Clostridia bacterium]|nr:exo-alpha-sialidase [Clostridia bacterium]
MKHRIVSRIEAGPFRYQAWPTLVRAKNGTLFLGASGHRQGHFCPFGKNYLYISTDEGESWQGPIIINDSWLDDRDVGLLAWGESSLLMCTANHAPSQYEIWDPEVEHRPHYKIRTPLSLGLREVWKSVPEKELERRAIVRVSHDNGKSWSEKRDTPVFAPHGPTLLPDGSLFYVGRKYAPDRTNHDILAYRSNDEGKTWEYLSHLPYPPALADELLSEPHAIVLPNGDVLAAVRSQGSPSSQTLKIYTVLSHDLGKTWEEPVLLDLCGAPPHLCLHSSGALILSYSRRKDPMGEYVRISYDFGKTWSRDTRISPEPADWDHGYPTTVELSDKSLLTAYYMKCPGDDFTSLHTVRWSLEEIE